MAKGDSEIDAIVKVMDDAIESFNGDMPALQKKAYARIIVLLGELDQKNGKVQPTLKNLKLVEQVKKELEALIIDKRYKAKVGQYLATWNELDQLNQDYYTAIGFAYNGSKVVQEYKAQAIDAAISNLQTTGIRADVVDKLGDIIRQNVTTGGSFAELSDQVRVFMTDTKEGDGALVKHAKTYTVDAISTYNSVYNKIAAADLGFVFYQYVGSLKTTSRAFCKELIAARRNGCMKVIHISQFDELLKGHICNVKVPIYEKTGLPYGMNPVTTSSNLLIYKGGFGCQHQFYPVSNALVDPKTKAQFNVT